MKCKYCNSNCIKKGKQNGLQKYQCTTCRKYQQQTYKKKLTMHNEMIVKLNNEGVGIRSIGRILSVSKTSVQRLIENISKKLRKPEITECNQSYEIDELRTYVGNRKNESWVMYAINKINGKVIDFAVGRRNKENLQKVVKTVMQLIPSKMYTDGLNIYASLIPKTMHKVFQYNINKIERKNLTLRTHLKRLSRKTICYSKSEKMLENSLKLYLLN